MIYPNNIDFIKYLEFLKEELEIEKNINRNKRDGVYNIIVTRDKAKKLSELLYISNKIDDLYIDRKYKKKH